MGFGKPLEYREAFFHMANKIASRTRREADNVSPIQIKEDSVDVFIRRGVLVAGEAGLLCFPRETGNGILDIGCQAIDFSDHDDAG